MGPKIEIPSRASGATAVVETANASPLDDVRYCDDLNLSMRADPGLSAAAPTESKAIVKNETDPTPVSTQSDNLTHKILDSGTKMGSTLGLVLGLFGPAISGVCEYFKHSDDGKGTSRGIGSFLGGSGGLLAGSFASAALTVGATVVGASAALTSGLWIVGLVGTGVAAYYGSKWGANIFEKFFGPKENVEPIPVVN